MFLYTPALHGVLGWWDELINLIPVVIGIVLVIYLYRNRRRRAAGDEPAEPESHTDPPEAPAPRP